MFSLNKCLVHACNNLALSTFDENGNISDEKNYCLEHIPNPNKMQQKPCCNIFQHGFCLNFNYFVTT